MLRTQQREELRLLGQLEAGLVVADATGDIVVWNEGAERILGLPSDAAIGRPWIEVVTVLHGGVTTAREVLAAAALPGGWHGLAECVVGNRQVRIRVHVQRLKDAALDGGRGYMALFWPTHEPGHRTRPAHLPSPVPYRDLFRRSPEAMALATVTGDLIDVNEAAAELFGWPRDEAIGRSYRTVLQGWTDADADACSRSLMSRGYFRAEGVGLRKNGSTFATEIIGTLLATRGTDYLMVRLRDLSHERRLERIVRDLGDLARLSETPRDIRSVGEAALRIVAEAFRAEESLLVVAAGDGFRIEPGANTAEAVAASLAGIDPAAPPLIRRLTEAGGPIEIALADERHGASWVERLHTLGVRTVWAVPAWFGPRLVGALILLWRGGSAEPFDPPRLDQMGRLAGVAIGNAELRDEMRREAERRVSVEGSARIGGAVVAQMTDSIITTDPDGRITAINPACERHYGFSAAEVIGRRFEDVIETLRADGHKLGREPLDEAIAIGYWQGRVVHRPRIGSAAGNSVIVDLSLTAIHDEQREFVGVIALTREVTASARLESEAAALSSLAVATGKARSRREVAEAALERLTEATNADAGLIVSADADAPVLDAARGIPEDAAAALRTGFSARLLRRLEQTGVFVVSEDTLTRARGENEPRIADVLIRDGIRSGLIVGLRVRGQMIGFLGLGSRDPGWARPSDDVAVQAAAQVANALENARLMERLDRGLAQEKRLTGQLETLIGLTQLPAGHITEQGLAQFLLERVVTALEALAGFVVVRVPNGSFTLVATEVVDPSVPPADRRMFVNLDVRPRESFYFWRRLAEQGGPFTVPIDETTVLPSVIPDLLDLGMRSYAAFPVHDGGELVAAFVCHFARPIEDVGPTDQRTLEAVGRIIEIAYANIRMGEGLAEAVEHERRLAAELRALQDLTLLGSASDDLATLARETITSVVAAVGASGGGYIITDESGARPEPIAWIGDPPVTGPAADGAVLSGDGEWRELAHLRNGERVCVCPPETPGPEIAQAALPLRLEDRVAGVLQLVWRGEPHKEELDVHFLEPIARIATISLANFRLRSELIHRAAAQRSLGQRLDALDELTRIGEEASSFEELAHRTANLVREALGAAGVCYLLLEPGHHFETHAVAGETGAFRLWLKGIPAKDAPGGGALLSGAGSVLADFASGQVSDRVLPLARSTGFRSYGAIPIRTGEELTGALLCFFDQPAANLPVDDAALDSVARITGIALANFLLRERLVSSEERYRTLFEESPEAMLVSALDGTVLDANEAAVRLYRVNRGEVLGRYIGQLMNADERELARRRQIVWAQGRGTFRDRGRRPDGSEFPIEVEVRVVELGGQRRFLSLVRDLSDQDRLQRELLQAQKMEAIGQLVSGVAHELNNPLAAIIAFSQLLRRDDRLPDDMKHDAGLLVQEADRTRRIVQNLLDFARQRPPERRPTRISTLVQSVLELQSYALGTNRIQVTLEIPDDLPEVDLDRAQLQQVLLNLTINAIQAIRTVGRTTPSNLVVKAELVSPVEQAPVSGRRRRDLGGEQAARAAEPARVRITITDDGPGVPVAARARLFDPFFTTKQPGEGTGLGLSVSFGIVAAHDGQLWYEPGPGGVGSSFIIELPVRAKPRDDRRGDAIDAAAAAVATPVTGGASPALAPVVPVPSVAPSTAPETRASTAGAEPFPSAPAARNPTSPAAPAPASTPASTADSTASPTGRPTILVLDDEPSIRAFLRKALGVAGMDVVPFQDGGQALEYLKDASAEVMLIDHRMAGMSGTEFFEAAVRLRPELSKRAVFMSGDVLNPDLRGFATKFGIRLLAKPFDIDAVTRVVRESLASNEGQPS